MKVIVFDLGGTLMEFQNMPLSWVNYYKKGFESIAKALNNNISNDDIDLSVEIMKSYNPRVNYREIEYTSQFIFEESLKHWKGDIDIEKAIKIFFDGINLMAVIYRDSIDMLKYLKSQGYIICALTDIPSAMPDKYFKDRISELLKHIDLYVSSQSCGYRKPNPYGIKLIADNYNVRLSDLIFVGDEEKDKKLSEKIGCKFYLIDRKEENKNADIHNMLDLKNILKCSLPLEVK
ncbi:MAG: HAD family hydrolase [Eubacterium sp.]|nr:HAD family hydrolase [Eubacterium sp.]